MSEGAITFTKSGFGGASGLALTCETDFAAKSETFVNFSIDLLGNLKEKVEKAGEKKGFAPSALATLCIQILTIAYVILFHRWL